VKTILDPTFRYRNSAATDVRKTFERIRRQQLAALRKAELAKKPEAEVVNLSERKAHG
jgi:hypothetical protein